MFFKKRPFPFDHDEMSILIGFDTNRILRADPKDFPVRKPEDVTSGCVWDAYACPELQEQIDTFNESFGRNTIVYFLKTEPWPHYTPADSLRAVLEGAKRSIATNASEEIGFGRPMVTSDVTRLLQYPADESGLGLLLLGTDRALTDCRVTEDSIIFEPFKHLLKTIAPQDVRDRLLIDRVLTEHWKRWRTCFPYTEGPRRTINGTTVPRHILRDAKDQRGIEYDSPYGFRGLLEGLRRLSMLNEVIRTHDHRNIVRGAHDFTALPETENKTPTIVNIDGSEFRQ